MDDEIARSNFRVVVIVPDEVDQVDLTDPTAAGVGTTDSGRREQILMESDRIVALGKLPKA